MLLTEINSAIVCQQETFLKENDKIDVKNSESYNYLHNTRLEATVGVLILIRNDIPQSKINLNTSLKAIAAKSTYTQNCKYLLPIYSYTHIHCVIVTIKGNGTNKPDFKFWMRLFEFHRALAISMNSTILLLAMGK